MLPKTPLAFQMQGTHRKNTEGRHRDAIHLTERVAHIFEIIGHVYTLLSYFDPLEAHQRKTQKQSARYKDEKHYTPDDPGRSIAHSRKFYN